MSTTQHPLSSAYANSFKSAINNTQAMNDALETAPKLITPFSDASVSQQFAAVAKTISVQSKLSTQRQVFFVSMGGFDTHDNQLDYAPGFVKYVGAGTQVSLIAQWKSLIWLRK